MAEKPSPRRRQARKAEVEPGSVDELVRIFALSLRYTGAPQGALVHDMSKAGWAPSRIAELLGTTANTVAQQKRRKRPQWPKQ